MTPIVIFFMKSHLRKIIEKAVHLYVESRLAAYESYCQKVIGLLNWLPVKGLWERLHSRLWGKVKNGLTCVSNIKVVETVIGRL
jgi:hypothetical protein